MNNQTTPRATVPFISYLEGLRGVAALYVVLFHIRQMFELDFIPFGPSADLMPFRGIFLLYGHYAVSVFIVISGFVLTLPVALRGELSGGWLSFFMRRARRLFPAYYVALTLAIPFYLIGMRQMGAHTSIKAVLFQWFDHALFLQDLWTRTISHLNGPLWSVAVEVQIYVVFVFALLPILRRAGLLAMVSFAVVVGFLPTIYGVVRHEASYPLQLACFWYLGLFAAGSAAAIIAYDREQRYTVLCSRVPWKVLSMISIMLFIAAAIPNYDVRYTLSLYPALDTILGLGFAFGFIAIAKDQIAGRKSLVASVFSWKPLVWLGTFSYSLYLIHAPIVTVVMGMLYRRAPSLKVSIAYFVMVPLLIVLAYLFGRVFETPFMSKARQAADKSVLHGDTPVIQELASTR